MEMNNVVEAQLHMTGNGASFVTNVDRYSIATYAYSQLLSESKPDTLKAVCANLLQYGSKAQLWKGYRTDALADGAMTEEHRSYLTDPESVVFGDNKKNLEDFSDPSVTFVGMPMRLDSKIVVRFVINPANYAGKPEELSLRLTYVNMVGETKTVILTDPAIYHQASNYYSFDFDGLLAPELRTVMSAVVYAGDTRVSETMEYSVDSYGNGRTGTVLTLVQAMIAFADSAKVYFS